MAVTLTLEDEIDISRGDMIVRPGNVPRVDQKFEAMVVWMGEEPILPGSHTGSSRPPASCPARSRSRYQIDVNTLHRQDAPALKLNEIGRCLFTLSQPIAFDAYRRNRATGAFIVIDRLTNSTVAAGMILDRSTPRGSSATTGTMTRSRRCRPSASQVTSPSARPASARPHDPADRPHRLRQDDDRLRPRTPAVRSGPRRDGARRPEHAGHQQGPWLHRGRRSENLRRGTRWRGS